MTEKQVWLITGAGRGLGVDIAKAALSAGHAVVATGRDAAKVAAAVGNHESLLATKLDVTRPQDAQAAVDAAVAKFGRIDVLVNNAGNFFAGFAVLRLIETTSNRADPSDCACNATAAQAAATAKQNARDSIALCCDE